jgi:hypothetical protein
MTLKQIAEAIKANVKAVDMAHPRPYTDWIAIDLEWVPACDVLLRLDGESSGADGEVAFALEWSVPVVYSVAELLERFPPAA